MMNRGGGAGIVGDNMWWLLVMLSIITSAGAVRGHVGDGGWWWCSI